MMDILQSRTELELRSMGTGKAGGRRHRARW